MNKQKEIEDKVKELKAEYYKKYRERNKEKIKKNISKYWFNKAKKELEKSKEEE